MRTPALIISALLLLSACGHSNDKAWLDAANATLTNDATCINSPDGKWYDSASASDDDKRYFNALFRSGLAVRDEKPHPNAFMSRSAVWILLTPVAKAHLTAEHTPLGNTDQLCLGHPTVDRVIGSKNDSLLGHQFTSVAFASRFSYAPWLAAAQYPAVDEINAQMGKYHGNEITMALEQGADGKWTAEDMQ